MRNTFPRTTDKALLPNFALIDARDWANPDAIKSFKEALKKLNLKDLNASNVLWEDEEPCTLAEYRDWLFPEGLKARRQFDLENIELWFLDAPFKLFLSQKRPKPPAQSSALGKRKVVPEIIKISDNNNNNTTPPPPAILGRHHKRIKHEHKLDLLTPITKHEYEPIDLTADTPPMTKHEPKPTNLTPRSPVVTTTKKAKRRQMKALRDPQATIKITTSEYVSEIVNLKELPSHWNPSKHTKAY
ncbi:hypothetical protein DXG01_008418 [Tephrocybe rancida]|nr:hypothetical protein DXG01_008418 [Tephrocybe rancida]